MNIPVTKQELAWLINGVEAEMEANRTLQKEYNMPEEAQGLIELQSDYMEQEKLLEKLKEILEVASS